MSLGFKSLLQKYHGITWHYAHIGTTWYLYGYRSNSLDIRKMPSKKRWKRKTMQVWLTWVRDFLIYLLDLKRKQTQFVHIFFVHRIVAESIIKNNLSQQA